MGVAIDTTGNVFVADYQNLCIRKIDVNGIITTIAGNGTFGYSGDGGLATAAQIGGIYGIAAGKNGNIFISDRSKNRVRQIDANGYISTIAGNGTQGYSGDSGIAVLASLYFPNSLAVDTVDNLLITYEGNSRVRKVNSITGVITTIAGNGTYGYSGDGGPATAASLSVGSIATDIAGNLFIGGYNGYIRKVNTAGIISTIAGGGTTYGDGGPATAAQIQTPNAIAIDKQGNMYIADRDNNRIRKITVSGCGSLWTGTVDNNWENPQNWACGQLPDYTTDVVIHSGTTRINSNVVVRSLHVNSGVNMVVGAGYRLTLLQ